MVLDVPKKIGSEKKNHCDSAPEAELSGLNQSIALTKLTAFLHS